MMYSSHLETEVIKYCEVAGIPLINGIVPAQYSNQVNKFIESKMRADRIRTREKEELDQYNVGLMFKRSIGGLSESPIEEYMFNALVNAGLDMHCRRQFEIGKKRVDIAFPIAKLVVECDGKEFHHANIEQIEKDQARDKYLAKKGWQVKHFDGLSIRRNIDLCIEEIRGLIQPFIGISA